MLGECRNPDIKSMIIKRHNDAVQLLYKAVLASDIGGCYTIMDAGHLPGETIHDRIPRWILPNTPGAERTKMRPDLLLITGLTQREANNWSDDHIVQDKTRYTIHIFEIGYGSDTCLDNKERTKLEQHTSLISALHREGWTTNYTALPLGTTGGITNNVVNALKDRLKLTQNQVDKTCRKLHDLAIHAAHALVRKRRYIEYHKHTGTKRSGYTNHVTTDNPKIEHSNQTKTVKHKKNPHQTGSIT